MAYEFCPLFADGDELIREFSYRAPRLRVEACRDLREMRYELLEACPVCNGRHRRIVSLDYPEGETISKGQLRGVYCNTNTEDGRPLLLVGVVDQIAEVRELTTIDI